MNIKLVVINDTTRMTQLTAMSPNGFYLRNAVLEKTIHGMFISRSLVYVEVGLLVSPNHGAFIRRLSYNGPWKQE